MGEAAGPRAGSTRFRQRASFISLRRGHQHTADRGEVRPYMSMINDTVMGRDKEEREREREIERERERETTTHHGSHSCSREREREREDISIYIYIYICIYIYMS